MSRIYATEDDNGRRHLVRLECDAPGCAASTKPGKQAAIDGWTEGGSDNGPGTDKVYWVRCPEHSR